MSAKRDPFGARSVLTTASGPATYFRLDRLEERLLGTVSRFPFSIKVLLEALLRNCDGELVTEDDVAALAGWKAREPGDREVPFQPARVLLQDFTGVPAVVDLAAMRSARSGMALDICYCIMKRDIGTSQKGTWKRKNLSKRLLGERYWRRQASATPDFCQTSENVLATSTDGAEEPCQSK